MNPWKSGRFIQEISYLSTGDLGNNTIKQNSVLKIISFFVIIASN